jgi:transposase
MAVAPWIVSDELWELFEPLLPKRERRFRYPGRKRLDDRLALQGILFVLHTGIAWAHLPAELGFGSGVTCWRRLDEWQRACAGVTRRSCARRPSVQITDVETALTATVRWKPVSRPGLIIRGSPRHLPGYGC